MGTTTRVIVTVAILLAAGVVPATADEPVVLCDGKPATMLGTPGDDKIIGDASDDVIVGFGGNDTLVGAGGNDTICGFDGDDTIIGGPGDDVLLGGRGSDWLDYRSVSRRIMVDLAAGIAEGHGNDTVRSIENVHGSPRRNYIYGNGAANILRADGDEPDILWGRGGDDIIEAGRRFAELRGGAGDDHLSGVPYVTEGRLGIMHGGSGNDTIESSKGTVVTGAGGDDLIRILTDWSTVHPGSGDDTVEVVNGSAIVSYWHSPGPIEVDLAAGVAVGWGSDQLVGVSRVNGTRFDDVMRGAPAFGEFSGFGGDDVLEAAVTGAGGGASLIGGRGRDVLRGSGGDDELWGGPGSDVLLGLGGNDHLRGGEGRDEIDGGEGIDAMSYVGLPGPMVINLSAGKVFGPGADFFTSIESALGSRGDDHITGTMGPNELAGWLGNDTIYGRGDDDTLRGDGGNDTIYAGFGGDYVAGGAGDDAIYGGADADELVGGAGNDTLFGGQHDDNLAGGPGDDTLDGGPQFDTCKEGTTYISCEMIL